MLPSAKLTLAGTYFAEQVAVASYDLVCIAHADAMNRPSTQHSMGGSSSSSRPNTVGGPRRRQVAGGKVQCTELPSLNSIELLLDPGGADAGSRNAQLERDAHEELRARRSLRMRKISARLCRGEVAKGRSEFMQTPNDMEVLAALTQPLPFFTRQLPKVSGVVQRRVRHHGSVGAAETARTYHDAVAAGLVGTDLKMRRPRKAKPAPLGRRAPKNHNESVRSNHSSKSLDIIDVPVLPEFAAEAWMVSEALAIADEDKDFQSERSEARRFSIYSAGTTATTGTTGTTNSQQRKSQANFDMLTTSASKKTLNPQANILQPTATGMSTMLETPISPSTAASPSISRQQSSGETEAKEPEVKETKVAIGEVALAAAEQEQSDPHSTILEAVTVTGKMGTNRREAAQSLRTFIFGCIAPDKKSLSAKEIDRHLRDKLGAVPQVQLLHNFWTKLDSDRSGSVDLKEFRSFVDAALKDITDGSSRVRGGFSMQAFKDGTPEENASFARQLIDRVGHVLLGRKAAVVIEDVMRIIWPCSRNVDIKTMKGWVNELELNHWRREPPKQIAKDEFDGLAAVFKFFDKDASGTVTVEELVLSGFLDKEQAIRFVSEQDDSGDGELSMLEFCELFCPTGYRAHSKAKIGTDEAGRRLVYDDRMKGWRLEEMDPGKAGLFS